MIKRTLFLLIFTLLNTLLFSLDSSKRINQYLMDIWNNKNGLPQSYVSSITQTKKGYIWVGTQEGLVRFDGVSMVTYSSKNVSVFKSNIITYLLEDNNNNLWIGTLNGLIRYKNGIFKRYTTDDGLIYNLVRYLEKDDKGNLWIGTDNGLCKYNNNKFTKYDIGSNKYANYIVSIVHHQNKLLIATKDQIYTLIDNKISILNKEININSDFSALYIDRLNNLWIGTVNKGLYKYSNGNLEKFTGNDNKNLSGTYISSIIEDSNDNLWVGTQNGGLNRIYKNNISSFSEKDGLPSNYILNMFEDSEKNLWIGSAISGLNRLRDGKVTVFGPSDGIIYVNVRTVFQDSKENLWVGTGNGGLYKKHGEIFISIDKDNLLNGNEIRTIMEDASGNIWVGTIGSGIYIIQNDKLKKFKYKNQLSSNSIFSIFKDSDNIMWIGTTSGIAKYENGKFSEYTSVKNKKLNTVRVITEDKKGNIWFAIEGIGIAKIENKSKINLLNKKYHINSSIITCIYFDSDNTAWLGTYGGGLNYIKDNAFFTVTNREGLFSNSAYTIVEDKGRLWMSCNNGIYNVLKNDIFKLREKKIDKLSCINFNESSGMKNRECNGGNYPVAWKDKNGILWFPNVEGLVKIDPKKIKPNNKFPKLIIEKMIIDEKEIKLGDKNIVKPGYKRIEFKYTALEFTNPRDIKFKVRLKGIEARWINMGTARKAYYTLVPPGIYTFQVKSTNGEGRWNTNYASINIQLKPFFYQTKIFYVFILITLIILIILFIKLRLNSLNKKKIELEKEIKKRTIEIRQKNVELKKLSIVARETDNGIIITDRTGVILWANEGFEKMYGYTIEEFKKTIGDNLSAFSLKENFNEIINKCISQKMTIRYESENKTKDDKAIWVQTSLTPALDEYGNIKELIFVETDITKLKKAYNKMREMSLTDQLTKLKNRRYFHNLIDRDIQIAKRKLYKRTKEGLIYSMIFLMVDIDFFKKVNDTYGHNAGDQLLVQISERMKNTLRTSDLIVRWGGEEFLIMAKDDNFEGARLLSLRLLNSIEQEAFNLDGTLVDITISIGFCGFPILYKKPEQFDWEDIVQLADTALYIAKESGRKQSVGIKLTDESLTEESCEIIKKDFDKAINKGILELVHSSTDNKTS